MTTQFIEFSTQGNTDIIDISAMINEKIAESGILEGQVTLFAIGSTTGLSTIEYEPGLVHHDLAEMYEHFAPYRKQYKHNNTWGDDNGAAHLRSTLTGSSLAIPIIDAEMLLGTWQQVVFIDFDTRPRNRKVVVQIFGKKWK